MAAAARILRMLLNGARAVLASPEGRFGIVAIAAGVAVGVFVRDELIEALGWGMAPAGLWLGIVLLVALSRPRLLVRFWSPTVAAFFVAAAAVGIIGYFDGAEDGLLEDSTASGYVGDAIFREPAEWEFDGPALIQTVFGGVRVALLLAIAATVVWPGRSRDFNMRALRLLVAVSVASYGRLRRRVVALGELAERKLAERREAAAERAAAAAAVAAVETEASLQEKPSYRVANGEPEVRGMIADEPEERAVAVVPVIPDVLPTPAREELWSGAEASAVSALISAAQSAAGIDGAAAEGLLAEGLGDDAAIPEIPRYDWKLPDIGMLRAAQSGGITKAEIAATSDLIVDTLADHGIDVSVDQVRTGPTVTMYGIAPGYAAQRVSSAASADADGARTTKRVRVDTILNREKDLALALASPSLRFEAPIPGASLVGIEVPNASPIEVALRSVMETEAFREFEKEAELPVALGMGSGGDAIFADLTRMPHTLVAGATGSGKSVCMNSIITGLLLLRTPVQVRLILVDPKRVELTPYSGVPHLMIPPIVEADVAVAALRAVVAEMMERFQRLEAAGAKNIAAYNERAETPLPYIVIAVDELADLMLTSANEVERLLVRLAQLGRATGIHLVVATQRPSVDVVTGLIKANFPSRISFSLTSQVDSRTIIDTVGAEKLLGKGDMLFLPIDRAKPMRVQGAFLSDDEVESVVRHWARSGGPPMPQLNIPNTSAADGSDEYVGGDGSDELFNRALELAHTQTKLSTSLLQRRLRIGYPRAARLMDELEDAGVVGPGEPGKPRAVIG